MSDGDVSLIRDEDLLRRMWQQTEDFSRKKEIRAHMYRLREERLRSLYSPEPAVNPAKGCEFSSTQGHVKSFADQSFQSMKSKEVRDAGSPPKEFTYRGQDLKDLSNAGWNVESENKTTDDGHTHMKSVNANIEGQYDVDGGKGHFSAADHHKQAVTEYNDGNASLKRNEDYSNTSAHEQVVRQTGDGMHFTSTSSSSTSASKFEQVSSKHETVPYLSNDDYDLASQKPFETNRNEEISTQKISKTSNYEQSLRNDCEQGELVSRKIDYPDDNTKVIVETRRLPDGTRVTSTRREFHAPSVQTSRSEHHSQQIRNESKGTSYTTSQKRFHANESKQTIQDSIDRNVQDIVDSQRTKDDHDFRTNNVSDYSDDISHRRYHQDKKTTEINERKLTRHEDQNIRQHDVKEIHQYKNIEDNNMKKEKNIQEINNIKERHLNDKNRSEYFSSNDEVKKTRYYKDNEDHIQNITKDVAKPQNPIEPESNKTPHSNFTTSSDNQNINYQDDIKETRKFKNIEERVHNITNESNVKEKHEKMTTDQYQTTYQTDYSQRKISKDWSPTHQAWASTLRSDTPSRTTRGSSPGSKIYMSSTSSPRSSVSPDKICKRTPSRSGSPNKIDRNSPTRTISDKTYSSTQSSTYSVYETKSNRYTNDENSSQKNKSPTRQLYSPERKLQDEIRKRPSVSPEKDFKTPTNRTSISPQRKTRYPSDSDRHSPIRKIPTRTTPSPERKRPIEQQTLPTFHSDERYEESDKIIQTSSKNIVTQITSNTTTHSEDIVENETSTLKNIIKSTEKSENQPGYMRPTASSSPRNDSPVAPAKSVDSNRETSIKRTPSQSPERNYPVSKLEKFKEENNRFISEENKIHTSSKNNITSVSSVSHRKSPQKETSPDHHIKRSHQPVESPDRKLSSPIRTSPMKDTPDTIHNIKRFESPSFEDKCPEKSNDSTDLNRKLEGYKQPSRELSPVKQTITSPSKKTPTKETLEDKSITPNKQPSRETSPIKRNGSPDKVYSRPIDNISMEGHANIPRYNEPRNSDKRSENRSPSPNTNSDKQTSPIRNTISPSKESPKHKVTEEVEKTSINNKDDLKHQEIISKADTKLDTRTSRRSVSPKKPKIEDISSCKQTLDFIATERINEEINKTKLKERPRNLVTPSTSPTRKLKSEDTAPSTGQSSPTTTESGFVYFSSPRENILVTDLDDQEPTPTDSSKNLTDVICHKQPPRRTPSPTKIPCRSPSPEKVIIKESLPRKSSLKKPSIDNTNLISSVKPPTSFLISPNDEVKYEPDATQHTIENNLVKPIKNKPPLVRRETYEERCRKILGMTEEDSTATETKTIISHSKNCISSDTSPSISPCESPVQHEDKDFSQVKYETVDVLDITDSKYMQEKTGKPKEQLQTNCKKVNTEISDENLDFHSNVNSTQTVSEISKQISSKDSPKQISLPKIDDYDNNLCNPTSKTPKRKSSASPERPTLAPTHRAQDIKKEISQGLEIYESETDTDNINKMYTNITGTQNLTKNTETIDDYSQKTSESCKVIDTSSEFIVSEREQQILDRVQSSLRKLSPDRKAKTTKETPDSSPEKTSSILPKTNVAAVSENITRQSSDNIDKFTNISSEDKSTLKKDLTNEKLVTKSQIPSKPSSRNVSPIKKPPGSQNLPKNASENGKLRSASPKKPITHTENKQGLPTEIPQSPQIAKTTIGKTKDVISSQYHRTSSSSTIKNERTNMTDTKKTLSNKQQTTRISPTKTPTNKTFSSNKPLDVENKRASTPKGIHRDLPHNIKKEADSKVIRTSSDIGMKTPAKKNSAQRMKSKPDIYITASKVSKQATTTTAKHQKTSVKESTTKLPVSKPKSAIALNTSIDDEYVVIDVQQAKSSRENSPDRICPTPVGFSEDVGTPRFPDEVNEPDDEYNKYKNHIIHETESIVDDIVEISEEDELFVKRSEVDNEKRDTTDECLLSVYDKVTKFTNQVESHKPKDSTTRFKDTEKQVHSDFVDDNLKSDECLLSVSEKVNKFAKGSVGPKDRSPSRNITEEYDRDTVYTDDYTKLSVNDKAHLFIETAENVKTTKPKSIQKPERPNFTTVDDSLKSDECLLSVSDKVNKFVKTAEQVLSDTYVVDEKDKKIKEQHDKIMKQIVNDVEDNLTDVKKKSVPSKLYEPISDEEEKPDENESVDTVCQKLESNTNKIKTTIKSSEKPTPIKITTLRSSEAVKKAKALFENIASTTNTKEVIQNKTTKLKDLGISKKITKSRSDTNESHKHVSNITAPTKDKQPIIQQTDYDKEQDKESLHQRQRSPDHDQKSKAPIIKEKSPITRITSPTTTRRDISPANRPVSPFTREKSPINRTLSPITREKSPTSKIRSPITRDKSPTTKTKSPAVKEDAPISRTKSPIPQVATITTKKVLSRFPVTEQNDSHKQIPMENHDKPIDKVPGYQRPTRTSQIREEKHFEEVDVSSRRGSGKFGVELRRTSADRSSVSSERRRSSVEHHQPCIEDIFDLDLLEQMLEKVVGYEQRRRIRAQIRIAKKKFETEQEMTKVIRSSKHSAIKVTKAKSPERQPHRSPERLLKSQKPQSPERQPKITPNKTSSPDRQHKSTPKLPSYEQHEPKEMNGHAKEPNKIVKDKETRPQSPEKQKSTMKTVRSSSPDKKSRPTSPSKTITPKPKGNRFSEYASAYMKKVGLNESNKLKQTEVKTKKAPVVDEAITKRIETSRIVETHQVSKTLSDRTSSKDIIEVVQINGRKPQSPERSFDNNDGSDLTQQSRKQCHEGKPSDKTVSERKLSPERIHQSHERQIDRHTSPKRSPSPVIKKVSKKETTTASDIEKKIPQKQVQEEKPSWVTNRQLKKVTSDTRTFSSKKIEQEKPKYRPSSPSKAITKPIDVITSSYGPGPLDADGKPLFGIKALRNGATNYQVKGTVIRQEFHSRNGGEPEGTVSVTAYSTQPEDLEKLLQSQGEKPSRLHGLAAITTTKRFGGDTGTTLSELSTKEERAALDQFTHSDRRVTESKIERHSDTFDSREQKYTGKTEESERYGKEKQLDSSKRSKTESCKKETRRVDSDSQKETRAERMQKTERRVEDRKTVRQSSVKSLTEKFIKNASETSKTERTVYPKAGLILRTAGMKDSVSSDSSTHAGLARTDSEHSLGSVEDMVTTTTTTEQVGDVVRTTTTTTKTGGRTQERSFLDSSTKVTGVQDILTRMKNADIVIEEGDTNEDSEARALLNKFLGATVLMAGMQSYVTEKPAGHVVRQETVKTHSSSGGGRVSSSRKVEDFDLEQCWDERVLRKLLEECTDYELRRRLRARIRALMAEQEACASAVTEALAAAGETVESVDTEEHQQSGEREEEEVTTVTSSVRRNSSEQTVSSTTVKNTKVIECTTRPAPKPVSPFAKFRQLEKQNSINSPKM